MKQFIYFIHKKKIVLDFKKKRKKKEKKRKTRTLKIRYAYLRTNKNYI